MDTKEIRKSMKKLLGYNARMVSVKKSGGSLEFTIRNSEVDYKKLKSFSENFESYSRDEATGCILRGGNTFCFIYYSPEVTNELINKNLKEVEDALSKIDKSNGCLITVEGTKFMVGLNSNGCGFSLWKKSEGGGGYHVTQGNNARSLSLSIGTK